MEYELNQIIEFTDEYPEGLYDFVIDNGYTLTELEPIKEIRRVQITEKRKPTEEEIHQHIMELTMTPLDFLKALETIGITYEMVKQIMEENPLVERELRFCSNVYRKHPMINQFATQFGVSQEQLDYIFKKANGEID